MKELKLIVIAYENDKLMEILFPMLKEKFREELPDVEVELTTGLESKRPTFTGVKQGLVLFNLYGYFTPSDLVTKFKNTVDLI